MNLCVSSSHVSVAASYSHGSVFFSASGLEVLVLDSEGGDSISSSPFSVSEEVDVVLLFISSTGIPVAVDCVAMSLTVQALAGFKSARRMINPKQPAMKERTINPRRPV